MMKERNEETFQNETRENFFLSIEVLLKAHFEAKVFALWRFEY